MVSLHETLKEVLRVLRWEQSNACLEQHQSESHLFVTFDIAEYLEKKGVPCKLYVTKKPDIVFAR